LVISQLIMAEVEKVSVVLSFLLLLFVALTPHEKYYATNSYKELHCLSMQKGLCPPNKYNTQSSNQLAPTFLSLLPLPSLH
jgi:hypothetical protein